MINTDDLLFRATVCHYFNEIEDIILFSKDLNGNRDKLKELLDKLGYLVVDEA